MHALVQRVARAEVRVEGETVGAIGAGLLVFVCAEPEDDEAKAERMVDKLLKLRIFAGAEGRMDRSVQVFGGGLLLVSQFTLAADVSRGHRPSFSGAAPAAIGRRLFDHVVRCARERHSPVSTGVFGADMQVALINDGPVTIGLRV